MKRHIQIALVLALLFAAATVFVYAGGNGSSGGQVTISNTAPTLASPMLLNTSNISVNGTSIDVNVEYWINVTVHSDNTLEYLNTLTFTLWDGQAVNASSPDLENSHYTLTWTEATDSWS